MTTTFLLTLTHPEPLAYMPTNGGDLSAILACDEGISVALAPASGPSAEDERRAVVAYLRDVAKNRTGGDLTFRFALNHLAGVIFDGAHVSGGAK